MPKIRYSDPSSYIIFTSISLRRKKTGCSSLLSCYPIPIPIRCLPRRAGLLLRSLQLAPLRLDHLQGGRLRGPWSVAAVAELPRGLLGMGIWTWKFYCQSLLVQFFIQVWIIFSVTSIWSKTIAQESKDCVCFLSNAHFYAPSRGTFILIVSHSAYLSISQVKGLHPEDMAPTERAPACLVNACSKHHAIDTTWGKASYVTVCD